MTEPVTSTPVEYSRTTARHQASPLKLKTKRFSTGAAGTPTDINWGGGSGTFFTGSANAIGCIDDHEKLRVYSRSVGKPPLRLAQGFSVASQRSGYRFIDPEAGRIGFFNYETFEDERVLENGVRPLCIGPTSYFERRLIGTDGGYVLDYDRKVMTPASPVSAVAYGPEFMFWYLSGDKIHWVDPDSGIGRPLAMPYPVQADELVLGPEDRSVAYLDKSRDVIGLVRGRTVIAYEVEEFELPAGLAPRSLALNIGTLWFTGRNGASLFRFDRMRTLYEYACADTGSDLARLSFGADVAWFTEPKHAAISRANLVGL